jgi:hypothetical protein
VVGTWGPHGVGVVMVMVLSVVMLSVMLSVMVRMARAGGVTARGILVGRGVVLVDLGRAFSGGAMVLGGQVALARGAHKVRVGVLDASRDLAGLVPHVSGHVGGLLCLGRLAGRPGDAELDVEVDGGFARHVDFQMSIVSLLGRGVEAVWVRVGHWFRLDAIGLVGWLVGWLVVGYDGDGGGGVAVADGWRQGLMISAAESKGGDGFAVGWRLAMYKGMGKNRHFFRRLT